MTVMMSVSFLEVVLGSNALMGTQADAVGECIGEPLYCVLRIWA